MAAYLLLLLLGLVAGAASVVFIKASAIHPVLLASYRMLLAAFILMPVFLRELKARGMRFSAHIVKPALLPGVLLALHFIAWIMGARMTLAANATLIVNMLPAVMPIFAYLLIGEVLTGAEAAGTLIALAGVVFLGISDYHAGRETFLGDVLCFISMVLFAGYLIAGKRNATGDSIWIYAVPLYAVGGIVSFVIALFFTHPFAGITGFDLLMAGGLAVVSTIFGHTILNFSMRKLRSQIVALANLSQIVYGSVFGLIFFAEKPDTSFFIAAPVVLAGAALAIVFSKKSSGEPAGGSPRRD
ncbi:MAG: DMT family transporter [Spirochaetia bacterium]